MTEYLNEATKIRFRGGCVYGVKYDTYKSLVAEQMPANRLMAVVSAHVYLLCSIQLTLKAFQ